MAQKLYSLYWYEIIYIRYKVYAECQVHTLSFHNPTRQRLLPSLLYRLENWGIEKLNYLFTESENKGTWIWIYIGQSQTVLLLRVATYSLASKLREFWGVKRTLLILHWDNKCKFNIYGHTTLNLHSGLPKFIIILTMLPSGAGSVIISL